MTTQEQIAELLVARGWAHRLPLSPRTIGQPWERCTRAISLLSVNPCLCSRDCRHGRPKLYVLEDGQILTGHTRREARPVGPQTRRRMLGGDE